MQKKRQSIWIAALLILVLTSNGIFLSFGEYRLAPERLLMAPLFLWFVITVAHRNRITDGGFAGKALLGWITLSLLRDVSSQNSAEYVLNWINIATSIIWYYYLINIDVHWQTLRAAISAIGASLASIAVAVILARSLGVDDAILKSLSPSMGRLFRIQLFSVEPNIFGATMCLAALLIMPLATESARKYQVYLALALIALIGAISRAPWIAFMVGALVYIFLTRSKFGLNLLSLTIVIGLALGVAVYAQHPEIFDSSIERQGTIGVRILTMKLALRDIFRSPIRGNGSYSFRTIWPTFMSMVGSNNPRVAWIGEAVISVLHDTGVVGLVLMITFWFVTMRRALKAIQIYRVSPYSRQLFLFNCALFAGGIALLVQDQSTTIYGLALYWAYFGVIEKIPTWTMQQLQIERGTLNLRRT